MSRFVLLFLLIILPACLFSVTSSYRSERFDNTESIVEVNNEILPIQDTLIANQILYNGKIWIGLYFGVYGTEFLFSEDWIDSDLTIEGIEFKSLPLKYDTYNDELLINFKNREVVILNKERVDSFTIRYNNSAYKFINLKDHDILNGYYQILYNDGTSLYKKWSKKRAQFVVEAKYDEFQPDNQLILIKDQTMVEVTSKRGFLKQLDDYKQEVKEYIRDNRMKLDIKSPETLVPVLKFYDTLKTE
jgi:hypothetical protein